MALLNVLKTTFFSSVFFRLSLMLKMYEAIVVFVWFGQLLSKYKNSFLLFLSRFALLILGLSAVLRNIAIFTVIAIFKSTYGCR